eukprot:TRINITY_DN4522_c0_g1_i1.p1 TRINITY_DN4522_c0_g1~~TRINITY_DN4522_c0_g1_i1.p1  ORF type:complete len:152 (-),score=23.12 TRINITY_DN4522_c0_g1_i1:197-652(-)
MLPPTRDRKEERCLLAPAHPNRVDRTEENEIGTRESDPVGDGNHDPWLMEKSSDQSSDSTDTMMEKRRVERLAKDRNRIRPINQNDCALYDPDMAPDIHPKQKGGKGKNADISPMEINLNIDWNAVGGAPRPYTEAERDGCFANALPQGIR